MNASDPGKTAVCPLCHKADKTAVRFRRNGFLVHSCRDCRWLFVHPVPSADELSLIYSQEYFERGQKYAQSADAEGDDILQVNARRKTDLVRDFCAGGRILDVGCATGDFLVEARGQGFDVKGVELSDYAAGVARRVHGLDVFQGGLLEASFPAESFDVVTLWDVIEHVPDTGALLKEVRRILKPGGHILASTGDSASWMAKIMGGRWHLLTPPQHLYFFTPDTLFRFFEQAGFRRCGVRHDGKHVSWKFFLFKAEETFGRAAVPFKWIVKTCGLSKSSLYINLGDIMTCVGRKEDR